MEHLLIAGTVYEPLGPSSYTVEYDLYMQRVLQDAGVVDLLRDPGDRTPEQLTSETIDKLVESGQLSALLAGFVQVVDRPWSAREAKETAATFAKLTSPHDRRLLLEILAHGLADFFQLGLTS